MKNLLFILTICFFATGCTRMTIPVNVLPFLLVHENPSQRTHESEKIALKEQIVIAQQYAYLPQQQMLTVDPFREEILN
ncbi:MAG: hypothetical protein P9L94_17040 [Candidatus Hinthialibacter antarcticus]|nr:hypothetical protein [Candidatus Hinthialibacter antarcticus]